ncbi:hypothetical protein ACRTEC_14565 [Janibacter indicus]
MDPVRGLIHLGLKTTEATLDRALDVVRLVDTMLVSSAVPPVRERTDSTPTWPQEEQGDLDALSTALRERAVADEVSTAPVTGPTASTPATKRPARKAPARRSTSTAAKKAATKKSAPAKKATVKKAATKKAAPAKKSAAKKATTTKAAASPASTSAVLPDA